MQCIFISQNLKFLELEPHLQLESSYYIFLCHFRHYRLRTEYDYSVIGARN